MLHAVNTYKDNTHNAPEHIIDPKLKDKSWMKSMCEYVYSQYLKDKMGIPYSKVQEYETLRTYGQGNQSIDKYKDRLMPKSKRDAKRKGWMNISWDILSVAPKFRRVVIGMFEKMEHDVSVNAIDDGASGEKENMKWRAWAEAELKPMIEQMGVAAQVGQELPFVPDSMKELELLMDIGGFKLKEEIAMEKFLAESFYISNWNEIRKSIYEDFFDLGIAACKDYICPLTKKVKSKHCDPSRVIVRHSKSRSFENTDLFGVIEDTNIAQLRQELLSEGYTEEEVQKIAKEYVGFKNNKGSLDISNYTNESCEYDDFSIQTLDLEWISTDYHTTVTKTTKSGKKIKEPRDFKYQGSGEINRTAIQQVYKAKWIIGTDVVYQCGLQNDTPRKTSRKDKYKDIACLSGRVYKYSDKSLLSGIVSILDDIQIGVLKFRNSLAMAAPPGLAIETGTLDNLTVGGEKMHPMDVLRIRRETGDLLFRATTHHSQTTSPNSGKPVFELQGGMGNSLNEFIQTFTFQMQLMRDILGISEVVDTSTPQPDLLVKVMEGAIAATNNALQPIYGGYVFLKEQTAENKCLKIQILAQNNQLDGYYYSLGKANMEIIKSGADIPLRKFAIKLELKPSAEHKERIRNAAQTATQVPLEQGGISMADFLEIEEMLNGGKNLKYVAAVLMYKEKKNKEYAVNMQRENMQLNAQTMQQTETAKAESYKLIKQIDTESAIVIKEKESALKLNEIEKEYTYKLQLASVEKSFEFEGKKYAADKNHEGTQVKSETEINKTLIKAQEKSAA